MKLLPRTNVPLNTLYLPNKYTQWYYNLVFHAQSRQQPDMYCEKHHIIPVCLYKHNRRNKNSQGFLLGDPDQLDNIVVLTYREHVIAHWLLTKMVDGRWVHKMHAALSQFRYNKNSQPLTSLEISRIKTAIKDRQRGLGWYNNGQYQVLSLESPGPEFQKGMLRTKKDYKFYTNGAITTLSTTTPGPEWRLGRSPNSNTSKGMKWYNNGTTNIQSRVHPGAGWVMGRFRDVDTQKQTSKKLKGIKWWYNGERWTRAQTCPGPEWTQTKRAIQPSIKKGHKFWNNGVIQRVSEECPGPEWAQGRIPGTSICVGKPNINKGRKLWNNGIKQMTANECPGPGWVKGRLKKSK